MSDKLERLMRKLNYQFNDKLLLIHALTHCSAGENNYERLEFLGDSILSVVIAAKLYEIFPDYSEGNLSRLRSHLVKGDTIAVIGQELELGQCLVLGQGELKSGGFRRASILADSFEAVLAAIYLDGGFNAAREVILQIYASRLAESGLGTKTKDYKTQLQELLQGKKKPLPEYQLDKIDGVDHDQVFNVSCQVKGMSMVAHGSGSTRRKAEQLAAERYIELLNRS